VDGAIAALDVEGAISIHTLHTRWHPICLPSGRVLDTIACRIVGTADGLNAAQGVIGVDRLWRKYRVLVIRGPDFVGATQTQRAQNACQAYWCTTVYSRKTPELYFFAVLAANRVDRRP
jgi:hypothetical protein